MPEARRCDGTGRYPVRTGVTAAVIPRHPGLVIGLCEVCGGWVKLNQHDQLRYHRRIPRGIARREFRGGRNDPAYRGRIRARRAR